MRVVVDVNVWVSGLLWRGVPGRVLDLAAENQITIYTSKPILVEIEEILPRPKFHSRIKALDTSVKELLATVTRLSSSCTITSIEVSQL